MVGQRLVVLDRDGVINQDSTAFIKSPAEWQPFPQSLTAIGRLYRAGYRVVVCTNQSGIARGLFSPETLSAIHARMDGAIRSAQGRLAGIFICPHGPDDGCPCRKPRSGLLQAVERHFGCTLRHCPVVGDSSRDLEAASRIGARPILVRTGNGERTFASGSIRVSEVYADLTAVADQLIREAEDGV